MNVSTCLCVLLLCVVVASATQVPEVVKGSRRTFLTITETGEVLQGIHQLESEPRCSDDVESPHNDIMCFLRSIMETHKAPVDACDEKCIDAKVRAVLKEQVTPSETQPKTCDSRADSEPLNVIMGFLLLVVTVFAYVVARRMQKFEEKYLKQKELCRQILEGDSYTPPEKQTRKKRKCQHE